MHRTEFRVAFRHPGVYAVIAVEQAHRALVLDDHERPIKACVGACNACVPSREPGEHGDAPLFASRADPVRGDVQVAILRPPRQSDVLCEGVILNWKSLKTKEIRIR